MALLPTSLSQQKKSERDWCYKDQHFSTSLTSTPKFVPLANLFFWFCLWIKTSPPLCRLILPFGVILSKVMQQALIYLCQHTSMLKVLQIFHGISLWFVTILLHQTMAKYNASTFWNKLVSFPVLPRGVLFTPHLIQSTSLLAGLQDAVVIITSYNPFHW